LFDSLDGLDSAVEVVRPGPSLLQTQDGHLWLSRREGVWSIDPAHIARNPVAPIVSVEDLICSGTRYEAGAAVSLPTGSRNLRIDYTAAALTHPERMHFHYRLVGVDEGWQEVGSRRQAYYTNLAPGAYEFQVMAANEDGVWSTTSAVLRFTVRPAFYQRLVFKVFAGVLLALVVVLMFILRLEQVQRHYRQGMDARHAERERIARDIHDTLLQGVQALLFRLHMWEEDPQLPQALRAEVAEVARQTKSIVIEGRERILMMRRSDAQRGDLVESLAGIGNEACVGNEAAFEVTLAGEVKTLTVHAKEQLLDIAREAVRNAYQHACANRIAVKLEYRKESLLMSIADDGRGVDSDISAGRSSSSHFGVMGMRERARQLDAQFHIHSKSKSGTRVEVIVPARTAFRDAFRWPWQRQA
jgi:signal transduction histidine kinase